MKTYAIFPGDADYMDDEEIDSYRYPHLTLADEIWTLRYKFTVPSGNDNPVYPGFRLIAQADNRAQFSVISKQALEAGQGSTLLGEIAEFSNPGENGDVLDLSFVTTDPRFAPGEHYLDVTIKNSKFPAGQEPAPGANDDWAYNPGGVAFVILNLRYDDWDDRFDDDYEDGLPDYMVSSAWYNNIVYDQSGSMTHNFNLTPGAWPITWEGVNSRNCDTGKTHPNASRMAYRNGKEIQLWDNADQDWNGKFEILDPDNTQEIPYGDATVTWNAGNNATSLTGTATPNDPTFQFTGLSGSDAVAPMASTTYKFIGIGPGGTDIEEVTIL